MKEDNSNYQESITALETVCREKYIKNILDDEMIFGAGVLLDIAERRVYASKNANAADVANMAAYTKNLTTF